MRSEGRLFPVEIEHLAQRADDAAAWPSRWPGRCAGCCARARRGDVLVFLPGAGEIRRAAEALAPLAGSQDLLVLPLHGELPPAEQNRAVRPADRRKVILSTNVAETSVTIDGVVAVIDSGLARLAAHSPWTGLPTLAVGKISQASADPARRPRRPHPPGAGAAPVHPARLRQPRRPFELPEIARLDLAEPLLALHALGVRAPGRASPGSSRRRAAALAAAEELLRRLGAVDGGGALTETGRAHAALPAAPAPGAAAGRGRAPGRGASRRPRWRR